MIITDFSRLATVCLLCETFIMIRKVNLNEMQTCSDVIKESFASVADKFNITKENAPSYVAFSTTPDRLSEQYLSGREMYVYVIDEHIVGFFSLSYKDSNCEINNLCVLPEYRHKKIGRELLQYAIQRAISKQYDKITLSIVEENTVLKEWYSSFGFVRTHTKKYDFFPFTCGYMELKL